MLCRGRGVLTSRDTRRRELAKLGDISSFRMGPLRAYFLNDPEMIRDLLIVNAHKFVKGRALQRAKSLLGEGLLTSEGEFHLRQRRMIQPAFHMEKLSAMADTITHITAEDLSRWHDADKPRAPVDLMEKFMQ